MRIYNVDITSFIEGEKVVDLFRVRAATKAVAIEKVWTLIYELDDEGIYTHINHHDCKVRAELEA